MRPFCLDHVTMFSGHKVDCNCHFTIFVVATPSRHWGLNIFRIFSGPLPVPEALLHCRIVVVAKLKSCCVPSSGSYIHKYYRLCHLVLQTYEYNIIYAMKMWSFLNKSNYIWILVLYTETFFLIKTKYRKEIFASKLDMIRNYFK